MKPINNKKPMSHIAHLFKSINTYDYVITLIKRRKNINFMRIYWFIIWTKLNPVHQRMFCVKFGWNWPSGSGEQNFIYFVNVFSLFLSYLPLEKSGPFIWTNLNPLHLSMLCAKFDWNWPSGFGEDFLNLSMYFCYIVIIYPWKAWALSYEQTWIPFTQGCFLPSLVEIGPVVLEKKMKMWKVYDNNDNDDDGQRTNFDQKSLRLMWAKKYFHCLF